MRLAGVLATVPTAGDALVAAAPLLIGTGCTWTRGHGRCGRAVTLVGPFVCDQCRDAGAVPMQRKRLLQEVAVTPDPWRNRVGNLIRAAVESLKEARGDLKITVTTVPLAVFQALYDYCRALQLSNAGSHISVLEQVKGVRGGSVREWKFEFMSGDMCEAFLSKYFYEYKQEGNVSVRGDSGPPLLESEMVQSKFGSL